MSRLADFVTILVGLVTIIGLLVRIAWSLGQLTQRFGDHVISADKIHADQEHRLRDLERLPRPAPKRSW